MLRVPYSPTAMRIVVLGAGHVGRAIVDALFEEHEITVIDTDADRLTALADRYDVRTVEGNGTTNLSQQGYSRTTIKVGQQVRTLAVPARNGTPSALMRRIEDAATGKELVRSGNDPFSDN